MHKSGAGPVVLPPGYNPLSGRLGYGAIAYNDLRWAQRFTRFIESEGVPADATVVDHSWLYVNKNGGPDRRFNNNRQLPVLQLGVLVITSSKGLNIQLNTSNPQQSLAFADCWRTQFRPSGQPQEGRIPSHAQGGTNDSLAKHESVRKILGVGDNASEAEISAAYRRLAQMYHPDKVAGLAPEFQALAENRMKEINAAYEALKQKASQKYLKFSNQPAFRCGDGFRRIAGRRQLVRNHREAVAERLNVFVEVGIMQRVTTW